jgi:hypothetical protein
VLGLPGLQVSFKVLDTLHRILRRGSLLRPQIILFVSLVALEIIHLSLFHLNLALQLANFILDLLNLELRVFHLVNNSVVVLMTLLLLTHEVVLFLLPIGIHVPVDAFLLTVEFALLLILVLYQFVFKLVFNRGSLLIKRQSLLPLKSLQQICLDISFSLFLILVKIIAQFTHFFICQLLRLFFLVPCSTLDVHSSVLSLNLHFLIPSRSILEISSFFFAVQL